MIPHQPGAIERAWWAEVSTCLGIDPAPPIERVNWWIVLSGQLLPDGQHGGWWQPPHTIYLASARWTEERLVKHEMIHDLLQTGEHPMPEFACETEG